MRKVIIAFVVLALSLVSFVFASGGNMDKEREKLIMAYKNEFDKMMRDFPDALSYSIGLYNYSDHKFVHITVKRGESSFIANGGNKDVIKNYSPKDVKYLRDYYLIVTKSYKNPDGSQDFIYATSKKFDKTDGRPKFFNSKPPLSVRNRRNMNGSLGMIGNEPVIRTEGYYDFEFGPTIRTEGYFDVDMEPVIRTEGYDDFEVEELLYKIELAKRGPQKKEVEYLPVVPLNE